MSLPAVLAGRAVISFLACFLAIWVWSRTREESWVFMIAGTLISFAVLMIEILSRVGIFPALMSEGGEVPFWFALLQLLPYLSYALGFGFYLWRNRRY